MFSKSHIDQFKEAEYKNEVQNNTFHEFSYYHFIFLIKLNVNL